MQISIEVYARKAYGINCHSLRYSGITSLLKKNVSPVIIAKITGHKKLDQLIEYAQQIEADRVQREQIASV